MLGHTLNDRSYIGANRNNKTETPRRGGEPKQNALVQQGTSREINPHGAVSRHGGHDLPSGHPNRGPFMPTDGDTLEGTLKSTPTRGDTERTDVRAQSVLRQAVTPNPYLGAGR